MSINTVYIAECDRCGFEWKTEPYWSQFKYDMSIRVDGKLKRFSLCDSCTEEVLGFVKYSCPTRSK